MKESYIQTKIIKYLESIGWYVRKIITANKNGTPDILGCDLSGRFWAFEVKTDKGVVSKLQTYNIREINERNGNAYVVRSVDDVKIAIGDSQ